MFGWRPASALTRAAAADPKRLLSTGRHRSVTPSPIPEQAGHDRTARSGAAPGARTGPPAGGQVDFEQSRDAFRSKDSSELLRSLLVFKLCSYDFLVDNNKQLNKRVTGGIMDFSKKVVGQNAFDQIMKMTFYGQFVGGEDHVAIKPLIQRNQAFGVGSVLDYSVEEDIDQSSSASAVGGGSKGDHNGAKKYDAGERLGDSQGVLSGDHLQADEAQCDRHMESFIKCIKASGGSSMDGFSAIKMTALGRPQLLLHYSELLVKWKRFFTFLASQQGKDAMEVSEQRLELSQMQEFLTQLGANGDYCGWFREKNADSSYINITDWSSLIDDREQTSNLLVVPNVKLGKLEPLLQRFTEEDEKQLKRTMHRLDVLAKHALENGVHLLVDAEQTYFQPAISRLTREMQRIHNRVSPVVFNTYQCYLKEAYENVTEDMELSRREGWHFAAKLVRGAYMYQERERAKEFGYDDPINLDYESTSRMYHRCLDFLLKEIALNRKTSVMVASHNEDTIKYTLRRMSELGLLPRENKVFFGQLLGMCDQISFPLGQAGFPVYKYVPFGPVKEVMPYLSRRAQENRGFMKGAQKERNLLWKELKRRLLHGELLHRPLY